MDILEKILHTKLKEIEREKALTNIDALRKRTLLKERGSSFISYLESNKGKMALIAEVKKASPSKGIIKSNFDHIGIAKSYIESNVSAISILTDEQFFQGSKSYLEEIREMTEIPILRKDFIIDEYQVYQTKQMGSDMILLIVSALKNDELKKLFYLSKEIGLDVLVETHDEFEFERAMNLDAKLIGINNRNLKTFKTDISTTLRLMQEFKPDDRFIISESGISGNQDIKILKSANVSGVLVGETLMRSDNIKAEIELFLEA